MTTRVLLADDHILFAQAIAHLLAERFEVVDIVGDGKALQTAARRHKPDVIVADITMPLMSGLDSIRSLRKDPNPAKIVFLTMHADTELARECFNSGATGFVTKERCFDELVVAIETAMANRSYLTPSVAAGLIDELTEPNRSGPASDVLTARQREILQLLAEGKTVKEIASVTNLSTRTVEWHKYRMMKMLHVQCTAELIQHAVKIRLVV